MQLIRFEGQFQNATSLLIDEPNEFRSLSD